jgi:hypothetical protein
MQAVSFSLRNEKLTDAENVNWSEYRTRSVFRLNELTDERDASIRRKTLHPRLLNLKRRLHNILRKTSSCHGAVTN